MITEIFIRFEDDEGNKYHYQCGTYLKKNGKLVRISQTIPELFEIKKVIAEQLDKTLKLRDSKNKVQEEIDDELDV